MRTTNLTARLRAAAFWPERNVLALLLAVTMLRGLIYTAVIPPWQAPDEPYHFSSALAPLVQSEPQAQLKWREIQTEIKASMFQLRFWDFETFLPLPQSPAEIRHELDAAGNSFRLTAPRAFTYHLLSLPLSLVGRQDIIFQLYWARLWSIFINLGVVLVALITGRTLFGDDRFSALLVPILIIFHPQHTFIMASVNDGNIAELLACVAILGLTAFVIKGPRLHWILLAGVFTGLAASAKPTGVFLVPTLLIVAGVYAWRKMPSWWKVPVVIAAVAAASAITVLSPRLMGSVRLLEKYLGPGGLGAFSTAVITMPFQRGFWWAFRSFWAFLGWEALPVGDGWVWLLLGLTALAVVGWSRLAWRHLRRRSRGSADTGRWRMSLAFLLCIAAIVVLLALKSVVTGGEMYIGRYLFGAIVPIVSMLIIGWRELIPPRWRLESVALVICLFFVFDMAVLLDYAVPFFYPIWR